MDLIKIKTNEYHIYYINPSHLDHFMYDENEDKTSIYTSKGCFKFAGDETKQIAKMLTTINEGHLMVMGEEWIEVN